MSNLSWGMRFLPLRFCALAQNLVKNKSKKPYKSFCYFLLSQKVESSFPYRLQTTKKGKFADSTLDSTNPQNLTRKMQNPRISHEVRKSFCYFLLLQKVESSLPYRLQTTKKGNFAESHTQCESLASTKSPQNLHNRFYHKA